MAYAKPNNSMESSTVQTFLALLYKHNKESSETVHMYKSVLKINKRNKKQQRIFLLTNKAIYNIKPKNNTIQRRIALLDIASITLSLTSTEFTLNIPSQYDYHYDTIDETTRNDIISAICNQMNMLQHTIFINKINNKTTKHWTVNKDTINQINKESNNTLRLVTALEHLENMGFKRNMARNTLNKNKYNLSLTIQTLIHDFVTQSEQNKTHVRSPFKSKINTPITVKLNSNVSNSINSNSSNTSPMYLTPSITQEVDELDNMFDICQ